MNYDAVFVVLASYFARERRVVTHAPADGPAQKPVVQ
ncbi:hypothetical protein BH09ACT12_BH09ACT12_36680 [soil metagenome]